jgi:hypothetical protein
VREAGAVTARGKQDWGNGGLGELVEATVEGIAVEDGGVVEINEGLLDGASEVLGGVLTVELWGALLDEGARDDAGELAGVVAGAEDGCTEDCGLG